MVNGESWAQRLIIVKAATITITITAATITYIFITISALVISPASQGLGAVGPTSSGLLLLSQENAVCIQ